MSARNNIGLAAQPRDFLALSATDLSRMGTQEAVAELARRGRGADGRKARRNPSPFWAEHLDQAVKGHEARQSRLLGFTEAPGGDYNLSEVDLRGRHLQDANFRHANLRKAKLSNADLSHAHLDGATLELANLTGARLTGAVLRNADLYGADLRGADLSGADLRGALMPDGRRISGLAQSPAYPDRDQGMVAKNNGKRRTYR